LIVQIYAMISVEDAISVAKAGADHIGIVTSSEPDEKRGIVSVQLAKDIVENIRIAGKKSSVILDVMSLEEIKKYISFLGMDILHICRKINREKLLGIKDLLADKNVKLMYAIPVASEESIIESIQIQDLVDFLMLDSPGASQQMGGFIGATGRTHDWSISKKIVNSIAKPVILGGGLSIQNVDRAIEIVNPYGVDAKTSLDVPGGCGKKDLEEVKNFIKKAKSHNENDSNR
jgi:phosphoribosylanthranilate isomerase